MKVALFTRFPKHFVDSCIVPDLALRGVDVVLVDDPKHARASSLTDLDMVLIMPEAHGQLSKAIDAARTARVRIESLSRKKAHWGFLPPPKTVAPPPPLPKAKPMMKSDTMQSRATLADIPGAKDALSKIQATEITNSQAPAASKTVDSILLAADRIAEAIDDQTKAIEVQTNETHEGRVELVAGIGSLVGELRRVTVMLTNGAVVNNASPPAPRQKPGPKSKPVNPEIAKAEAAVLALLKKVDNISAPTIFTLVVDNGSKIERAAFLNLMTRLTTEKKLQREGKGGKNSPFRYSLPE